MMMAGLLLAVSALSPPAAPRAPGDAEAAAAVQAEFIESMPADEDGVGAVATLGTLAALMDAVVWQQVRIEQRLIIRISPGGPGLDQPRDGVPPGMVRLRERRAARCLAVPGIFGVRPVSDSRLVLFMRDRRLIGADLARACNARDFYSGFYVQPSSDGQLCVKRDAIHSRAGTTCTIARLHELEP